MSLIHVKNLTFTYDGSYEPVFENASFQIDTGWRLGLIGRNGRGKTTLLSGSDLREHAGFLFPLFDPSSGGTGHRRRLGNGAGL